MPAKADARRRELVDRIADILLADGVADAPLRELAARLGTSDRMLLYYFEDKTDLILAAVGELSARLSKAVGPLSPDRKPPGAVLQRTVTVLSAPDIRPYMTVWADILARGGRGEEPFKSIAKAQVQSSLAMLDGQIDIPDAQQRRRAAGAILAFVEGIWVLETAAPGVTEGAAEMIASGFTIPED